MKYGTVASLSLMFLKLNILIIQSINFVMYINAFIYPGTWADQRKKHGVSTCRHWLHDANIKFVDLQLGNGSKTVSNIVKVNF